MTTNRTLSQSASPIAWAPISAQQAAFLSCPADEIFYGGSRGGGKTDAALGKFALKASQYGKGSIGIFFRSSREDLREAIARSSARLRFEYLESAKDARNYQGHSYTDLFFEELTNWSSPEPINLLRATLRSASGVPVQFHATGNPGGPGHQWVKSRYIDPAPEGNKIIWEDYQNPFSRERVRTSRVFIPAKLSDNPVLMSDPSYVARLYQSGSAELVRAWLHGDWTIVDGAFFDCWEPDKHIVRPYKIPNDWMRFRSCDVGLKLTAEEVAEGIRDRDGSDNIRYGVIDPAAFSQDGGPSIVERMRINWRRADNKRVGRRGAMGGWDQMRARMIGEDLGDPHGQRPMMYIFSTCTDFIRTVPSLQHDKSRPEDLDTTAEDHAADEARYGLMSRPYAPHVEIKKTNPIITIGGISTMTMNDLVKASTRRRKAEAYH